MQRHLVFLGTATGLLVLWHATRKRTQIGIVDHGRAPTGAQSYLDRRTATHTHQGIDIAAPRGSNVYAADRGKVAAVWPNGKVGGYGNTVVLQHADGSQTLYAHLDRFASGLAKGAVVARGQKIGEVGVTQLPRTPMTSKPHLHFEAHQRHTLAIREDNPPRYSPLAYLAAHNARVTA